MRKPHLRALAAADGHLGWGGGVILARSCRAPVRELLSISVRILSDLESRPEVVMVIDSEVPDGTSASLSDTDTAGAGTLRLVTVIKPSLGVWPTRRYPLAVGLRSSRCHAMIANVVTMPRQ